jgi:hypothetical protein
MSDGDDSDVDDLGHAEDMQSSEQQTSKPKATRKRVMSDKAKQKKKARFTSEQSHSEIADIYDEKRTKVGTKKNYRSRINVLKEYFQEFSPDALDDDGEVRVPLADSDLCNFFAHLFIPAHERGKLQSPEDILPGEEDPLCATTVKGYRSAIVDLYTQANLVIDPVVNGRINKMITGYEKDLNDLKKRSLMKPEEGRQPLPFSGYQLMLWKFLNWFPTASTVAGRYISGMFMWSFTTLLWNLMSRSDSVDTLMFEHISWQDDSLIIEEQGHKGDGTGENKYGKHLYANPLQPELCPVLSLAVYIFCSAYRSDCGTHQLFEGDNNKDR